MVTLLFLLTPLLIFHFGNCLIAKTMFSRRIIGESGFAVNSAQSILEHVRRIGGMNELAILSELRKIVDKDSRRDVTYHVYQNKLDGWKKNPAFGSTLASTLVNTFHSTYRTSFAEVLLKSSPGNVNQELFDKANAELHIHHEYEDSIWFPKFKELHPEIAEEVELMERDHAYIVKLEASIKAGNYEALTDFVESMNDHLMREELLTVPYLLEGTGGL